MDNNYCIHKVKDGDTIYSIADYYKTTTQSIITANININPFILEKSQEIIIPLSTTIVKNREYTYEKLSKDIQELKLLYPFLNINVIGKSVLDKNIYSITLGEGENCVLYNGAHHGNEWITSLLLMKWLEKLCLTYSLQGNIKGYNIKKILSDYKVVLVPMVNPDGVDLVINGLNSINYNKNILYRMNGRSKDFTNWKANIRGVDLNRNYNAGWEEYKRIERRLGIKGPCRAGFSGCVPESEPETNSISNYTRTIMPKLSLSFHSQGQIIYYNYMEINYNKCYNIARALSEVSGYDLGTEKISESYAGFKDWFLEEINRPALTIEVGLGKNPLNINQIEKIYEKNEELLLLGIII